MRLIISRIGHSRGRPVAQGFGKCGAMTSPRDVAQIGLVSGDGAAMLLSSGLPPHGEFRLARETAWNHGGRHDLTIFKNCR